MARYDHFGRGWTISFHKGGLIFWVDRAYVSRARTVLKYSTDGVVEPRDAGEHVGHQVGVVTIGDDGAGLGEALPVEPPVFGKFICSPASLLRLWKSHP